MKRRWFVYCIVLFLVVVSVPAVFSQNELKTWLRTVTDEEFFVEIERTSLVLENDGKFRANFRTILSNPEPVDRNSSIKYSTRLDTIQFDSRNNRYRIFESTFLDPSSKVVLAQSSHDAEWKTIWSGTGSRLYNAASQLSPLGLWKILAYHYVFGDPATGDDPPELISLIGSTLRISPGRLQVGNKTCTALGLDARILIDDDLKRSLGTSFKSLGIMKESVEAFGLTCKSPTDFPPQSLVLRLSSSRALMLWEGVFLEIERPDNPFRP